MASANDEEDPAWVRTKAFLVGVPVALLGAVVGLVAGVVKMFETLATRPTRVLPFDPIDQVKSIGRHARGWFSGKETLGAAVKGFLSDSWDNLQKWPPLVSASEQVEGLAELAFRSWDGDPRAQGTLAAQVVVALALILVGGRVGPRLPGWLGRLFKTAPAAEGEGLAASARASAKVAPPIAESPVLAEQARPAPVQQPVEVAPSAPEIAKAPEASAPETQPSAPGASPEAAPGPRRGFVQELEGGDPAPATDAPVETPAERGATQAPRGPPAESAPAEAASAKKPDVSNEAFGEPDDVAPDAKNETPASTPVGRKGSPLRVIEGANRPRTINGRQYSGHALDRMQERGLTPSVVEDTISRGSRTPSENGTIVHDTEQARVVTDAATGRVVTVMPR